MFLSKKVATLNKGKPDAVKPKRMLGGTPIDMQAGMTKKRRNPFLNPPFRKLHPPLSICSITHLSKLHRKASPQSNTQSLPLPLALTSIGTPLTSGLTCNTLPIQFHREKPSLVDREAIGHPH